jgi:hypothetical protein
LSDDVLVPAAEDTTVPEGSTAPSRIRTRLARIGARPSADPVLEPLFQIVRMTHPKAELASVEKAYRIAEHHHRDQKRLSGDPYITHPLAVASILAELGMTPPTLCAALLHDTVEDTATPGRCAPTSATRWPARRRGDQARQGQVRRLRQAERSARWSSRWPRTSGSRVIKLPTGAQHADPALLSGEAERQPRDAGDLRPAAHRSA